MATWRAKASQLFQQWRVARNQRKAQTRMVREQREADHVERLRAGIKDVHGGAG